ncbi:ABC transporter, ATP-binding protein [Thermococcus sp. 2319x1]|uniref:ATP-binding cassette domain-containing protein n=1 Tax=Thermococcus sp. 2319x1 TaxID=1674923 RepID=UPI00073A9635|nr:ATP-binding cassette domain-containing protein [Thermococcus sp. 2319x1]ALV63457.1 ABC transporter, ATP-binding protein [Thermococcus sp. 2319x1]
MSEIIIKIENLNLIYKRGQERIKALDSINLTISKGEKVGILGPNGAGKSSLIKILAGIIRPTSGNVICLGLNPFKDRRKYLEKIGVVFGHKGFLIPDVPVIMSLKLAAAVYGVPKEEFNKKLKELTEILGIERSLLKRPPRLMSLGQRIKFELISSLLHEPELLILDEALIGIDVVSRHIIKNYLTKINKELETTILISSHILSDVEDFCDRVIILNSGKLVLDTSIEQLKKRLGQLKQIEMHVISEAYAPYVAEMLKKVSSDVTVDGTFVKCRLPSEKVNEILTLMLMPNNHKLNIIEDIIIKEPSLEDIIKKVSNYE